MGRSAPTLPITSLFTSVASSREEGQTLATLPNPSSRQMYVLRPFAQRSGLLLRAPFAVQDDLIDFASFLLSLQPVCLPLS